MSINDATERTVSSGAIEAADAAHSAGLRYVSDRDFGIRRVRSGKGFRLVTHDGRAVRDLGAQADGSSWYLTFNTGTADSFTSGGLHFPGNPPPVLNALPESAGPVFTLPAGYTSNIPSMNVVDNYWTGAATRTRPGTWGSIKSLYRR